MERRYREFLAGAPVPDFNYLFEVGVRQQLGLTAEDAASQNFI